MKKIISLTIPIGFLAILLAMVILHAPETTAAAASQVAFVESTGPEQSGPPWYDAAWHYRRPVSISNNGASLPYYQVLITLDSSNFNFSHAKTDGSDIRFTHSDGTTELKYWIESWDSANQLAYLWVRVPSLGTGNTNIYLYYFNPDATPVSDGTTTFDSFEDDWNQFMGQGSIQQGNETILTQSSKTITSPFVWTTISGTPVASAGELRLDNGTGIKSTSSYQYNAVGLRANYGSGEGYEWGGFINGVNGQRSVIGDIPSDPDNLYLSDYKTGLISVILPRVGGYDWHNDYHVYEIRWSSGECQGDVDHGVSAASNNSQVPNTALPVTLYNNNSGVNSTLKVDWVYVRQYRDPEPTNHVGAEQGLVKLSITNADSPDPIRAGVKLTYILTISNTSPISACGVVVTDTLPVSVQIGTISSSQGYCEPGNIILCDLNIIPANSMASVTINVTPTLDGEITNFAMVGSPGYELDLSDNSDDQETLVDSVPPDVNWERPVQNGQVYYTFGNWVTLEASATDNDQVAWVEFRLWDHIGLKWVSIGIDATYPYQVPFISSILVVNQTYQMFVVAGDRAGNQSNPYDPLQVIYFERRLPVYLPLMKK
jgi:uncharacterized repeat protein (TIGR01451 family)